MGRDAMWVLSTSHCCLSVFQVAARLPPAGHSALLTEEEETKESVFTGLPRGDTLYPLIIQAVIRARASQLYEQSCLYVMLQLVMFFFFFEKLMIICEIKLVFFFKKLSYESVFMYR